MYRVPGIRVGIYRTVLPYNTQRDIIMNVGACPPPLTNVQAQFEPQREMMIFFSPRAVHRTVSGVRNTATAFSLSGCRRVRAEVLILYAPTNRYTAIVAETNGFLAHRLIRINLIPF